MKYLNIKDSQIRFEKQLRFVLFATVGITLFSIGYGKGISEDITLAAQTNETEIVYTIPNRIPTGIKEHTEIDLNGKTDAKGLKQISKQISDKGEAEKRDIQAIDKKRRDVKGIKMVYGKYATKTLNANVDWLYNECIKRGLDPKLVFAVQAKESGWGKSWYCKNHNNCFGYGYTDSGKVGNFHGDSYKEVTTRILDKYKKQGYGMVDAKTMAEKGYNFHPEWILGVNEIQSWFR